jgi:hypothetical protein
MSCVVWGWDPLIGLVMLTVRPDHPTFCCTICTQFWPFFDFFPANVEFLKHIFAEFVPCNWIQLVTGHTPFLETHLRFACRLLKNVGKWGAGTRQRSNASFPLGILVARADFVRTDWCAKHWSAASRRPRMDGSKLRHWQSTQGNRGKYEWFHVISFSAIVVARNGHLSSMMFASDPFHSPCIHHLDDTRTSQNSSGSIKPLNIRICTRKFYFWVCPWFSILFISFLCLDHPLFPSP